MPDHSLRTVRISLALMTFAGYLALATTDAFGPEIAVVPLALIGLMPVFERIDARHPMYRRITHFLTLGFTIISLPMLFQNLIVGLMAILFYIQTYLFLHLKTVRDYRYLFLMAFFVLVAAVAQSPDPAFGLIMPLFVLSAVWAFASLQIYAETLANAQGNIADLLPEKGRRGFLPPEIAQWVTGAKRDTVNVGPVLAVLSLGCVMITLVFFMFTPRMEAGVFGRSNILQQPIRSGLDEGVNLSRGGSIAGDEETVFLARFPGEPSGRPPSANNGELYWRVTSYNTLVGADWSREPGELDYQEWRSRERGVLERVTSRRGSRTIEQDIFLESTTDRVGVPALPEVMKIIPPEGTRFTPDDWEPFTLRVARSNSHSFTYRAISEVREVPVAELLAAPGNYEEHFNRNRALRLYTSHRLSARSEALARNLTANVDSPFEKARTIQEYLQGNDFIYTTTLEALPEDDPVDAFLFQSRAGHCELYASSMCMLMRSLGIPARVASGYKTTAFDWSEDDGGYIVRNRHAHLWVEVYLIGIGWHLFDPSGYAELDNSLWARTQRWLTRNLLNLKIMYYRDIVGFNSGIDLGGLISFSIGLIRFDIDTMRNALPSLSIFAQGLPRGLLILSLTLAVFWGLYVMYQSAKLRRRRSIGVRYTDDQIRATKLYAKLRHRLALLGVNGESVGARALFQEVEARLPEQRETVLSLVQTYNDVRFGGRPLDKQVYDRLVRDVRSIKKSKPEKTG